MQKNSIQNIKDLFNNTFNELPTSVKKLPISGSSRLYYRIKSKERSVIATYNTDKKENIAFINMSEVFLKNGINVPKIYAKELNNHIYLQEDLGDVSLFDFSQKLRKGDIFPEEVINLYKKSIKQLTELQINGSKNLDFSICYPRAAFDKQSIMWDLNYFKYNFLKFSDVKFDEQLLEDDFNKLTEYLLTGDTSFFLYRDFKSLNIMIKDNDVYFIDYQGGRKGALQYDIASMLYEAKADIPKGVKTELLNYYIDCVEKLIKIDRKKFKELYRAYILIRILQAMGTYGYRGLFEKKQHYIDSIPPRLKSLKKIIKTVEILNNLPELKRVLTELTVSEKLNNIKQNDKLKVTVKSFSYKRGIPYDNTGNGGGHVFDCRFIDNPGRIEKYKKLCGKDKKLVDFLENLQETHNFFKAVKQIVSASVKNYQSRSFKNLAINFGCTGGQHRSVYFAEKTALFLKENFNINVEIIHTEGF
ncbi:MAG: phosphotransferase [Bacteroidales bacterium]|nr:phosphotransferase [Bacteroidales bacterium]